MSEPTPQAQSSADADKLVLISPEQASSPKDFALWAGVILLAVLSAYSPALHGRFIWDDDKHVQANPALRNAPGLLNIWAAHWRYLFTGDPHVYTPQYYPMTHTTFWVEAQLSGFRLGQQETTVFHLTNFILHTAAAVLLWFLLRELAVPGAWVAAAIFALHPIQVESVAWISERKNVLAGVFFFASILAYVRALRLKDEASDAFDGRLYAVSLVLFALAVLSKTVACSMPAIMLLLIWWKRGRLALRDIARLAPFFVFGLALAIFTSWIERDWVKARGEDWMLSPVQRILIASRAVWFYFGKLLWPAKLTFIYPRWDVRGGDALQWIAPIGAIVVLAVLFALRKRIGRGPIVAALIYVGVLLPALGFFNFYPQRYSYVADHFQYLASAALIALLVGAIAKQLKRSSAAVPYVLAAVVLVALTVLTVVRANVYVDKLSLWRDTVAKNPNSWMAQNSLGASLMDVATDLPPDAAEQANKMLDEAAEHFKRSAALRQGNDRSLANWGRVLLLQKKYTEAISRLDAALEINPGNIDALTDRGRALAGLNRPVDAKSAYEAALRAAEAQRETPRSKTAFINEVLARVAVNEKRFADARRYYQRALALTPLDAAMHREYADFLTGQGDLESAAVELANALQLQPDYIDAHIDMGLLHLRVKNLRAAREDLRRAGNLARARGVTEEQATRLLDAGKKWSDAYEASTRPSTTRSTTTRATTTTSPAMAP